MFAVPKASTRSHGQAASSQAGRPAAAPGIEDVVNPSYPYGSAPATNVALRDQLPPGTRYLAGSTTNTCGVGSNDVNGTSPLLAAGGLNIGTLSIGERCEARFKAIIDDDVYDGAVLDNFFTITADTLPALLIGPATTVVQAAELGQPTKTVAVLGGGEPVPGSNLVYTVRIPNVGPRAASNVALLDVLPAQLEALQLLSIPQGSTNASTATTVDVRNIVIGAGAFAEVVFSARIRAGTATGTAVRNQGSVDQPSLPAPLLSDDPSTAATADATASKTWSIPPIRCVAARRRRGVPGRLHPRTPVASAVPKASIRSYGQAASSQAGRPAAAPGIEDVVNPSYPSRTQ